MGQFLDPPLTRKATDDVTMAPSVVLNSNNEEISITRQCSDYSLEARDTIDKDFPIKEPVGRTASCPQPRKVSDPSDPRGAVKYSTSSITWTTV